MQAEGSAALPGFQPVSPASDQPEKENCAAQGEGTLHCACPQQVTRQTYYDAQHTVLHAASIFVIMLVHFLAYNALEAPAVIPVGIGSLHICDKFLQVCVCMPFACESMLLARLHYELLSK